MAIQTSLVLSNKQEAFSAYVTYLAIKRHFNSKNYDYHKYNGKTKASYENFLKRPDVYFFSKLVKKPEYENIILANILEDKNVWIRDLLDGIGIKRYTEWKKKTDSLQHTFKEDLSKLDENYKENFYVHEGQHPKLLRLLMQKKISLETFTILCDISNIFSYWEQNIVDKFVAGDIMVKSKKYKPFLVYQKEKFEDIVRERLV